MHQELKCLSVEKEKFDRNWFKRKLTEAKKTERYIKGKGRNEVR